MNVLNAKKESTGADTKVGHLTRRDADLGEDINVSCGTVFVSYSGKNKHRAYVFIGCNANIVAPVTVGDDVFITAGSRLLVFNWALAIARQVVQRRLRVKITICSKD